MKIEIKFNGNGPEGALPEGCEYNKGMLICMRPKGFTGSVQVQGQAVATLLYTNGRCSSTAPSQLLDTTGERVIFTPPKDFTGSFTLEGTCRDERGGRPCCRRIARARPKKRRVILIFCVRRARVFCNHATVAWARNRKTFILLDIKYIFTYSNQL